MELYNYKAKVVKVIDGDTIKLKIDCGFNIEWVSNCRLAGINSDELKDANPELKESAFKAKSFMESLLLENDVVTIKSTALDTYRRPIVYIIRKDGLNVNECMLKEGMAKPYKP